MSSPFAFGDCVFLTERLSVGPWQQAADGHGIDLVEAVATILTPDTTRSLPPAWQGEYSAARARRWVVERDSESPTLLVVDRYSNAPVGLMMLYEDANEHDGQKQLRIGYVITESRWGQGIATELVSGLVDWARSQPLVRSISGGVDPQNPASARVLIKNGFRLKGHNPAGESDTYTLDFGG